MVFTAAQQALLDTLEDRRASDEPIKEIIEAAMMVRNADAHGSIQAGSARDAMERLARAIDGVC